MTEQEQWEQSLRDKHEGKPKLKVLEGGKPNGKHFWHTADRKFFDEEQLTPPPQPYPEHPNGSIKLNDVQLAKFKAPLTQHKPKHGAFEGWMGAPVFVVLPDGSKQLLGNLKSLSMEQSYYDKTYDLHLQTSAAPKLQGWEPVSNHAW